MQAPPTEQPAPDLAGALETLLAAIHAEFGWTGVAAALVATATLVFGLGAKLWAKRSRQHLLPFVVALGRRQWGLALVSLLRFWGTVHSTQDPAEFLRLAAKTLDRSGDEDKQALAVRVAALYDDALELSGSKDAPR